MNKTNPEKKNKYHSVITHHNSDSNKYAQKLAISLKTKGFRVRYLVFEHTEQTAEQMLQSVFSLAPVGLFFMGSSWLKNKFVRNEFHRLLLAQKKYPNMFIFLQQIRYERLKKTFPGITNKKQIFRAISIQKLTPMIAGKIRKQNQHLPETDESNGIIVFGSHR